MAIIASNRRDDEEMTATGRRSAGHPAAEGLMR
jgi:hypothetical protein